jgi:hypothetical protein
MTTQVTPVKKDDSMDKLMMATGMSIAQSYAGNLMGGAKKKASAPSGVSGSNPRDRYMTAGSK